MTRAELDRYNRRLEILRRSRLGDTLTAIGASLKISRQTVKRHLLAAEKDPRLLEALELRRRAEDRQLDLEYEP